MPTLLTNIIKITFLFLVFTNVSLAQKFKKQQREECSCYLNLDGSNAKLIDNALMHFDLRSIGSVTDSIYRIWQLFDPIEENGQHVLTLKMMQLGSSDHQKISTLYTLKWTPTDDNRLKILSNTKQDLIPKAGWASLDSFVFVNDLNRIHKVDFYNFNRSNSTFGLNMIQFFAENFIRVLDFSTYPDKPMSPPYKLYLYFKLLIYMYFPGSLMEDAGVGGIEYLMDKLKE